MSDPALPIQSAIVAALKGQTTAGTNVFDAVPSSDPFPRIVVGDDESVPVNDEADDECDYDPTEVFSEINVWSRTTGFPQAKTIASEVRGILHGAFLEIDGHAMEQPMRLRSATPMRDPDGKTRRVRMLFETRTAAESS